MVSEIRHSGVIEKISGLTVSVRILQESACSGCQAKSLCRVSESKEKEIEVTDPEASKYEEGQSVIVSGSLSSGLRAVSFAFGFPLVLLLTSLLITLSISGDEGLAAVVSLVSLLPYYLALYFFRDKIKRKFQFKIIG